VDKDDAEARNMLENDPIVVDKVERPMSETEKFEPPFVERVERAVRMVDDSMAAAVDREEAASCRVDVK